jgi:predicted secreted protein
MSGDPDRDALTYKWSVSGGALDSYCAAAAVFTAPSTANCDGENVTITVTVTDPCGLSATDTVIVRIDNVNQPPQVRADP